MIIDELIDYLASCGAEIPTVQNGDLSTMDTSTLFCNFSFPRHAEGGMFLEKKKLATGQFQAILQLPSGAYDEGAG